MIEESTPGVSHGKSIALGVLITVANYSIAVWAAIGNQTWLAAIFAWPSFVLSRLVPAVNLGTPEAPIHEGTPLHILATLAGIPLSCAVYGFIVHRIRKRRHFKTGA